MERREFLLPAQFRSRHVSQLRPKTYEQWLGEGGRLPCRFFELPMATVFSAPEKYPREYAEYMQIFSKPRDPYHCAID